MARYTIRGVDRETGMDTERSILADTPANAKVKAELKGIVVTEVLLPNGTTVYPVHANQQQPSSAMIAKGVARGVFWVIAAFVILVLVLIYLGVLVGP
ncbi:MAG: hypothetical protein HQ495_08725 [Alphaproteobacteria bacterium]|nr:hypothetical protein [Alphaproteobacteria bacterium]